MIVRKLADLDDIERTVGGSTWTSRRLLSQSDGLGISLQDTRISAGTETVGQYPNHLVAVYCISGEGVVIDTETETEYPLKPGTVYALDQHEVHVVRATTDMHLVYSIQHRDEKYVGAAQATAP